MTAWPGPETATTAGTDGRLVYAVGDVHGRYDLLKVILARITEDSCGRVLARPPMLVFCGDYVDRGDQSAHVIEALAWLRKQTGFELRLLKGNHEQALLHFFDHPEQGGDWISFGGAATLASYGVAPPSPSAKGPALAAARDALVRNMPDAHRRLLDELELMVVVGDYAFVHAGIRPDVPLADQAEDDLLWIRHGFLDAPGRFEKVIVHGHTWTGEVQALEQRIGIDTGAYATGMLTAARFDDEGVAVFTTPPAQPPSPVTRVADHITRGGPYVSVGG